MKGRALALCLAALAVASPTLAQQVPLALSRPWTGSAQCQITVQGPNYSDQQTHTWTLTGGTPTVQGAMRVFAGTWTVTGSGSLTRTQGSQTLKSEWTTNANMSAPIAVFIRASDGRLFIRSSHAQLRQRDGVKGTQEQIISGKISAKPIGLEAFEWSFPVAEGASTSASLGGMSMPPATGAIGPMQPAGSKATASCTWQYTRQ